jgi:hypothetical protein
VTIRHTGGNSPPSVQVLEPDGEGDVADETFTIEYLAYDPDDTATVSLYWDTDSNGFDGSPIVRDLEEDDGRGIYTWDTSGMEDGAALYVYAVVSDGKNPQARAYSTGPVTIDHSQGPEIVEFGPSGDDIPLDRPVRVTFDSEMDRPSVEAALSVSPSLAGAYSWAGTTVEFSPGGGWDEDTTYTVTVASTAMDVSGNTMAADKTWAFRTEEAVLPPDPPRVVVTSPAEGETVSGLFWIEGTSTNVGAQGKVEVRIDSGDWSIAEGTKAWRFAWDTEKMLDGEHTISVRGVDGSDRTGKVYTVNVTVTNSVNLPPEVEPIADITVQVGQETTFKVEASDPEGDDLVFSDDTELFDIDPTTGRVLFVPEEGDVAIWTVEVTVFDGEHRTKTKFIITVEPKEEEGLLLGVIPLTAFQLTALLVVLVLVVVGIWMLTRSRRKAASKGRKAPDVKGHGGETA